MSHNGLIASLPKYMLPTKTLSQLNHIADTFNRLYVDNKLVQYALATTKQFHDDIERAERWHQEHRMVATVLPNRGWYLIGEVPMRHLKKIIQFIKDDDLEQVDSLLIKILPSITVDADDNTQWLEEKGVSDFCVNRIKVLVEDHNARRYESATFIGMPLIDELASQLFKGKTLTTKRSRSKKNKDQSKPEIAFTTANCPDLSGYCRDFVQQFCSLQNDPEMNRLDDENYWNRHAIVHGMMRRNMGIKDSAKCIMAIAFLMSAYTEAEKPSPNGVTEQHDPLDLERNQ